MSRSFSAGFADRQAEVVGERVARPERAGHEAAGEQAFGDRAGPLRRAEVDQDEVRDRRADRPADRAQRLGQAASARVSTRARLSSRIESSRRTSVTSVTEIVEIEPGGRNGFKPGDHLGTGDAEPDPQTGQGVGLARGPDDDQVRVDVAQTEQRGPDELRVRLVEDDDRCSAPGRRPHPRRGPPGARRSRHRVRRGRSGCSGCTARRPRHRARRSRRASPSRSSAQPAASPRRGTATTVAAALLGHDAVHRVGRDRDDRPAAGRDERLGHDVEDLVGARPDEDLGGGHAVARRGGLDEARGNRSAGTRTAAPRTGPPPAAGRPGRGSRARC